MSYAIKAGVLLRFATAAEGEAFAKRLRAFVGAEAPTSLGGIVRVDLVDLEGVDAAPTGAPATTINARGGAS